MDALRATVAQERKDIAAESDHVAALAKVNNNNNNKKQRKQ